MLVKANAVELLQRELARKRVVGTIGLGSMNDPYMPLEAQVNLTGRALQVIARFGFPVHVITKSDLVLKDLDALCEIKRVYAAVSFTVTAADDDLAKKVEPGTPSVSARFRAMQVLAEHGIHTGLTMMPVLPFIEDNEENVRQIVEQAHAHGAAYILPSFGVTLRDRQRAYYYDRLDEQFAGLRQKYERAYGERYDCPVPHAEGLAKVFHDLCSQYGIATRMTPYRPGAAKQLSLF